MSQGEEEGDVTRREIDIAEVREMTSLDVMSMDASAGKLLSVQQCLLPPFSYRWL